MRLPVAFPAGLAAVLVVCSTAPTAPTDAPSGPLRILFIGNSLTAANNLPEMFRALATAGQHPSPVVSAVLRAGNSLEDHWNEGSPADPRSTSMHPWPRCCSKPHKRLRVSIS